MLGEWCDANKLGKKIGFIGGGQISEATIKGLISSGLLVQGKKLGRT